MISEIESSPGPLVLVVEDDATVADVVTRYLEREGFRVEIVADGSHALERAAASRPDLVLLDILLPGMNGLEICRRLRAIGPIPIIILTARGEESDRVMGFKLGADDYVVKPFSPRELTARIRAVLRRASGPTLGAEPDEPMRAGELEVDVRARETRVGGKKVTLTAREFELLAFFMQHPREVFRREQLLERVWGYTLGDLSTVTVHVRRLREKIESDAKNPRYVQTVWGVGYRFDP